MTVNTNGPPTPRWTHMALRVSNIDETIAFYTDFTPMELINRREDTQGYGAWLGHTDSPETPFVLVVAQFFPETDPFKNAPIAKLAPFAHIGIEMTTRQEVDDVAEKAKSAGVLAMPPTDMPQPIGYICMVSDPDGNMVEFSHDQAVYDTMQEMAR
jgi:lactoylglutathione lyase